MINVLGDSCAASIIGKSEGESGYYKNPSILQGEFSAPHADYAPQGDQPEAIRKLLNSVQSGNHYQTLLGVTGSGKTFTMANVIQQLQRPALIISHNKTLAAQLYSEFKSFFLTMRWNILSVTMIIISLKHMCLPLILLSKKTHP